MTKAEALNSFEEENKDFEKIFERYGYQMTIEEVSAVTETIERNKVAISALSENKGEWINSYDEDGKTGWYECSCCHSERAFNTNFCPDCGADMRGEE